jgi:hypothetical protein
MFKDLMLAIEQKNGELKGLRAQLASIQTIIDTPKDSTYRCSMIRGVLEGAAPPAVDTASVSTLSRRVPQCCINPNSKGEYGHCETCSCSCNNSMQTRCPIHEKPAAPALHEQMTGEGNLRVVPNECVYNEATGVIPMLPGEKNTAATDPFLPASVSPPGGKTPDEIQQHNIFVDAEGHVRTEYKAAADICECGHPRSIHHEDYDIEPTEKGTECAEVGCHCTAFKAKGGSS